MYQTSSEVIRDGSRLVKERDDRVEALRRDFGDGFTAEARGENTENGAKSGKRLAEAVKERGPAPMAKPAIMEKSWDFRFG